jgi:hypothetical protein
MDVSKFLPPTRQRTDAGSENAPKPKGMVHDNNRPRDVPPQVKNKVFQSLDEIYNNPVRSHNGAIFDESSLSVPFNINGGGKFNGGHY